MTSSVLKPLMMENAQLQSTNLPSRLYTHNWDSGDLIRTPKGFTRRRQLLYVARSRPPPGNSHGDRGVLEHQRVVDAVLVGVPAPGLHNCTCRHGQLRLDPGQGLPLLASSLTWGDRRSLDELRRAVVRPSSLRVVVDVELGSPRCGGRSTGQGLLQASHLPLQPPGEPLSQGESPTFAGGSAGGLPLLGRRCDGPCCGRLTDHELARPRPCPPRKRRLPGSRSGPPRPSLLGQRLQLRLRLTQQQPQLLQVLGGAANGRTDPRTDR